VLCVMQFDDFCWLEPHKGINVQPSTPSSVLSPTFMSLNGSAAGNSSAVVQQQQQQLQYLHGLADTALSSDPDAVAAVHCKFPAQVGNMWQEICRYTLTCVWGRACACACMCVYVYALSVSTWNLT